MIAAWTYFRSTPLGELVTGTAHESHPTDVTAPLGVRFAGRTIIAIHVALEKAATVRVAFDAAGRPRLSGIRNVRQRTGAEFVETLRAEVRATRAQWAVIVMATGWQAVLGQRAARADPRESASAFSRHKLMFDSPEVVVPRAQVDRAYTAVDHPVLDKSIVFSVRRRELDEITAAVRSCGLQIASVRVAVAAQLEVWLAEQGEGGLARDLVVSDGLSALLLNVDQGDFVPPRGAVETEQPRQAVQRPAAVEEDIARFINANAGRSVTFIGPEELCATVKQNAPEAEILRPQNCAAHDTQTVALHAATQHELNFEAREVRPAVPRSWRRFILGYAVLSAALATVAVLNVIYAGRIGYDSYRLERESSRRMADAARDATAVAKASRDFVDAAALRTWIAANYHAQVFCYRILREVPPNAALDKLTVEMRDGQITLSFVVLGDQETQLSTHRAVESAIKDLKYKIGGEDLPTITMAGARGVQYRLHIIVPDAAEATSV